MKRECMGGSLIKRTRHTITDIQGGLAPDLIFQVGPEFLKFETRTWGIIGFVQEKNVRLSASCIAESSLPCRSTEPAPFVSEIILAMQTMWEPCKSEIPQTLPCSNVSTMVSYFALSISTVTALDVQQRRGWYVVRGNRWRFASQ